jgi:hypothetical protein
VKRPEDRGNGTFEVIGEESKTGDSIVTFGVRLGILTRCDKDLPDLPTFPLKPSMPIPISIALIVATTPHKT